MYSGLMVILSLTAMPHFECTILSHSLPLQIRTFESIVLNTESVRKQKIHVAGKMRNAAAIAKEASYVWVKSSRDG